MDVVEKLIKNIVEEQVTEASQYDPNTAPQLACELSNKLKNEVKALGFERYCNLSKKKNFFFLNLYCHQHQKK